MIILVYHDSDIESHKDLLHTILQDPKLESKACEYAIPFIHRPYERQFYDSIKEVIESHDANSVLYFHTHNTICFNAFRLLVKQGIVDFNSFKNYYIDDRGHIKEIGLDRDGRIERYVELGDAADMYLADLL